MSSKQVMERAEAVEVWGLWEQSFRGPAAGNPYADVQLRAEFRCGNRLMTAEGFYDGGGVYKLRFMPETEGDWSFVTVSNAPSLHGLRGTFRALPPSPDNHGPVRVKDRFRFEYADGTRYMPFGTTLYHWFHSGDERKERLTLSSLSASPFNKVRMCVLPTGDMDPPALAFAGSRSDGHDVSRFNPAFFSHMEKRIGELRQLGIEADVILFHPYDRGVWGFERMAPETEEAYVRYVIARLSAYRNVWWSVANEYDFNKHKTVDDWDRLFRVIRRFDPYGHLRSIHNGTKMYDYSRTSTYEFAKPWVTHQSVQHWEPRLAASWLARYDKPVVLDECCYEGNAPRRWGNISGEEMVRRFWEAAVRGGYAGHGEAFGKGSWISGGGELKGESPERIAFLRSMMEQSPGDLWNADQERTVFWIYFGVSRPASWELALPACRRFHIDIVDTWQMKTERLPGVYAGETVIRLPGRSYMAIKLTRADGGGQEDGSNR